MLMMVNVALVGKCCANIMPCREAVLKSGSLVLQYVSGLCGELDLDPAHDTCPHLSSL